MSLPRKKTNININPVKIGTEYLKYGLDRIEELMRKTNMKTTFVPRTVKLRDIDASVFDFVKNKDIKLVVDGKDVPCFYLTKERWGEFSKTWEFSDNDKNILTPFITVRKVKKEFGTRLGAKKYTVAQHKRFAFMDVPILDEGEVINLRFKIPQPVSVDVSYEVRFFTKYQKDVNLFDEQILSIFSSRQAFCWIKGNPFVLTCESMDDDNIQDIKGDRMYVSVYQFKILAAIIDEKEFEIVKTTRVPKISISI